MIPWFEWPIIFDVRTRPRAIKSQTGTRDLQMVDIGLRVLTRPEQRALPEIYRKIGLDYDDKILPSIVNEVLKQVIAQFNATALLTQREQVSRLIKANLEERAKEFNLVLEVRGARARGDSRARTGAHRPPPRSPARPRAGRFHHGPKVRA